MERPAHFIRRQGDEHSIIKLHEDGREEIIGRGLTLVEAETLYFICIGEPVHEPSAPDIAADERRTGRRRPRQLAFKF